MCVAVIEEQQIASLGWDAHWDGLGLDLSLNYLWIMITMTGHNGHVRKLLIGLAKNC